MHSYNEGLYMYAPYMEKLKTKKNKSANCYSLQAIL